MQPVAKRRLRAREKESCGGGPKGFGAGAKPASPGRRLPLGTPFEATMSLANRHLESEIKTVFLMGKER